MLVLNGYEIVVVLNCNLLDVKIFFFSLYFGDEFVEKVFCLGVYGYFFKDDEFMEVVVVIWDVVEKGFYLNE